VTGIVDVDRAVAKKILAGDEKEFRDLFGSYCPQLFRFAVSRFHLALLTEKGTGILTPVPFVKKM